MRVRKNVLTTGEVAKLCNVAPRTVSKWFDAGQLRGYRIPGSKDRRIPLEHLMQFMRAHGIPLNGLSQESTRVVVLDGDASLCDAICAALNDNEGYEVKAANTALEAGALIHELQPDVVVADMRLSDVTAQGLVRFLRSLPASSPPCLIGMATGLSDADGQALLQEGFDDYLAKPFEAYALLAVIQRHTLEATPTETT